MSTAAPDTLMTLEEFFALPEDPSVERILIRGQVWEKPMTRRNKWHSASEPLVCTALVLWNRGRPEPRGIVAAGEAGCTLSKDPDTTVGVDIGYFSADVAQIEDDDAVWFDGPPILAVEILSPSDQQEEIQSKIDAYLDAGVKLVWIIDTHFKTVVVHRPDAQPEMFVTGDELTGDPHLPGFRVAVADLFPG